MRVIEQQMLNAIRDGKDFNKDNTSVLQVPCQNRAKVYLHGHHIASYCYVTDSAIPDRETLSNWPTNTTKSRLRALGVDVYTKKHVTYLNGEPV